MNHVQIWFVVVAGLLGIGIPFLFLGLELPNAMHSAILDKAAEYVILDEEDYDFWAVVPGRTGLNDTKHFYIFECTNPDQVAARGVKPSFKELGPFTYDYTHQLGQREYIAENGVKNSRVAFVKEFNHNYRGNSSAINKEYRSLNLAGMKTWQNAKTKARFQMAIEGFFELFYYAKNNLPRDMVIRELISHYHLVDPIYDLTRDLDLSRDVRTAFAYDHNYGLLQDQNIYEWSWMCDNYDPYIEHEILTYFGLNITQFEVIRSRYCEDYFKRHDLVVKQFCSKLEVCTYYNITFVQWFNSTMITKGTYKDYTFKTLFGLFEFPLYKTEFFNKISPEYKEQFNKVKWDDKSYHNLLDTYYEYPDYKTDEASVLLFDNMKKLFEAGKQTANPFKATVGKSVEASELDLSKFEKIANTLKLSKEQAFMVYAYFDYFVNNTVLLMQFGGTIDKERIANFGALGYKDLSLYFTDYLDLVLYTRSIHKRAGAKTCEEGVKFYFTINETESLMPDLITAICHNKYFNSDVSKAEGWKYFVEAVSYPYHYYWYVLEVYLTRSVPNFTNETLDAMLFKSHSQFYTNLEDLRIKVKAHYNSKTKNAACENTFSKYCSKRQMFFTQFFQSSITEFPYPEADLPASKNISDWWPFIRGYVEYLYGDSASQPLFGEPLPLPEKPIEVPVEFPWLIQQYGSTPITKVDLYNCFNPIALYDTDVLYYVFLNIKTPAKLTKCKDFATMFFFNSTRYILRNVEFGPMYDGMLPEQIYFGYYDHLIEAKHKATDYLDGDDCRLNPWIGHNPMHWDTLEKTYEHIRNKHKMHAGADANDEIRKYKLYYNSPSVIYRKLTFDETGDVCPFITANPYTQIVKTESATDGLQFSQYPGKTAKGDEHYIIDSETHRPLRIYRKTNDDFKYKDLEVNDYVVDFATDIGCENGLYIRNGIDMTSFLQMHSMVTKARLTDIDEPGLIRPNLIFTYPIESDIPPTGIRQNDSYYVVEPYTGVTMKFEKKIMLSVVLYYDELYDKLPDGGLGEILPYYSMYEKAEASEQFIRDMENDINSAQSSRKGVMVAFTIIGVLFVVAGIGMLIRGFFFAQAEPTTVLDAQAENSDKKPAEIIIPKTQAGKKENLLLEGEDLQKELKPAPEVQPTPVPTIAQEAKQSS